MVVSRLRSSLRMGLRAPRPPRPVGLAGCGLSDCLSDGTGQLTSHTGPLGTGGAGDWGELGAAGVLAGLLAPQPTGPLTLVVDLQDSGSGWDSRVPGWSSEGQQLCVHPALNSDTRAERGLGRDEDPLPLPQQLFFRRDPDPGSATAALLLLGKQGWFQEPLLTTFSAADP